MPHIFRTISVLLYLKALSFTIHLKDINVILKCKVRSLLLNKNHVRGSIYGIQPVWGYYGTRKNQNPTEILAQEKTLKRTSTVPPPMSAKNTIKFLKKIGAILSRIMKEMIQMEFQLLRGESRGGGYELGIPRTNPAGSQGAGLELRTSGLPSTTLTVGLLENIGRNVWDSLTGLMSKYI